MKKLFLIILLLSSCQGVEDSPLNELVSVNLCPVINRGTTTYDSFFTELAKIYIET